MNNTMIALVATEARAALDQSNAQSVKDRLLVAMKASQSHWMVTDENLQLLGAVAAVMAICGEDDKARLTQELRVLQGLSAAASGIPIDLTALLEGMNPEKVIGIQALWHEAKKRE